MLRDLQYLAYCAISPLIFHNPDFRTIDIILSGSIQRKYIDIPLFRSAQYLLLTANGHSRSSLGMLSCYNTLGHSHAIIPLYMVIRRRLLPPNVCLTININFVCISLCIRVRLIGRESSGGVPYYDYKWDMRVIIAMRCQGATRDDGDRYFIPNLLIVILLFPAYLCSKPPAFLIDFSTCNSYPMKLIESPNCRFWINLCDNFKLC